MAERQFTIVDATISAETRRKRSRSLLLFECQASISRKRPLRPLTGSLQYFRAGMAALRRPHLTLATAANFRFPPLVSVVLSDHDAATNGKKGLGPAIRLVAPKHARSRFACRTAASPV
jgi:hypothetical protein